jgi:hypothetical protein
MITSSSLSRAFRARETNCLGDVAEKRTISHDSVRGGNVLFLYGDGDEDGHNYNFSHGQDLRQTQNNPAP